MKAKKVLNGTSALGVKVRMDKYLDELSGKVLLPENRELANKMIRKLKQKPACS